MNPAMGYQEQNNMGDNYNDGMMGNVGQPQYGGPPPGQPMGQ